MKAACPSVSTTLRCAIYTRVSTDAGLEQDFNSLDAQREAAEAYIKSQSHEGWRLSAGHYDDGGYSGGSMERPGLQKLLSDIGAGRIDVVVVYKVDRLTRSLADFAKLVELFDANKVSFVSVTQSFNTTSSMGRLTLNVLLSFAQFEREVTGERIRDKIAASKKKGIWVGGVVPLGYRVEDRKLLIDEAEAVTVRLIFERYLALRSLPALQQDLRDRGITTRRRAMKSGKAAGGVALSNGPLAYMLRNRMYLGELNHKAKSYPGEHAPLLDRETFDAVQKTLDDNCEGRRKRRDASGALLLGLLYDDRGNRMTPSYAIKNGARYRYYVSCVLAQGRRSEAGSIARVSAPEIEDAVTGALLQHDGGSTAPAGADDQADWLRSRVASVTLRQGRLDIAVLENAGDPHSARSTLQIEWSPQVKNPRRELLLPPDPATNQSRAPIRAEARERLLRGIALAKLWLDEIVSGKAADTQAIATREGKSERSVRMTLSLAFLSPKIVRGAVEGTLDANLGVRELNEVSSV
jgi:site-specific DNA recombinase